MIRVSSLSPASPRVLCCKGAVGNYEKRIPDNICYALITLFFVNQFTGFSSPVENPNVMNIAKAGLSILLRFRLADAKATRSRT